MKNLSGIFILSFCLFSGCTKSTAVSSNTLNENPDTAKAVIAFSGSFINGPFGTVTGQVTVYLQEGRFTVALKDFMTSSGPDLHLYLSQEKQPIHFIELGKLDSTYGYQLYDFPGQPDFKLYTYVLIHCQQFNHLFGISSIQ